MERADKFLFLHQCKHSGYSARVSTHALKTLYNKETSLPDVLPVTSDLLKLRKYLSKEIPTLPCHLQQQLILFNKRRGGEATKVTIDAYRQRPAWTSCEDITDSLSSVENSETGMICNRECFYLCLHVFTYIL